MARWTVTQSGRTARRGRRALTARISGWPRSRWRIILGVASLSGVALRLPGIIARPGKATGLRLGLHERTAARLCSERALRLPRLTRGHRLVDVGRLRRAKSASSPPRSTTVRRGSASGPASDGRRDPRYALRSLRTESPGARFVQARRAHRNLFGRYPELATAKEEALGFVHDVSPIRLLKEALAS